MYAAVITAKDEAATIADIVRKLRTGGVRTVVVVDDGSTDNTGELAHAAGAIVIRHDEPRGIVSLVEAWKLALEYKPDYVLQMDAGGSHFCGEGLQMLHHADEHGTPLLIGSRFLRGSAYMGAKWRKRGSMFAAWMCNNGIRPSRAQKISDWTSGMRVFRADTLHYLANKPYKFKMHSWQIEVLWRALFSEIVVREYPITYRVTSSSLSWRVIDEAITAYLFMLNVVPK